MTPSLTDTLCTQCGLCCDGSLFADVELAGRAEATRLEVMGLEVEEGDRGGGLLLLPCRALHGRRCGIYAHRPECCRTFECRLLQETRRGTVTVERALDRITKAHEGIARVKELLRRLGQRDERLSLKERCAEALAGATGPSPVVRRTRDELEAAMSSVERLIRGTFL